MDLSELGGIYHFLLKYRCIESKPLNRKVRENERHYASILKSAGYDGIVRLNDFLEPQGWFIKEFEDFQGIPTGGIVWLMVRSANTPVDSFVSLHRVFKEMSVRANESKEETAIWFLHIWLLYLSTLYTKLGRDTNEVSRYVDATISKESLLKDVEEHIDHIRQFGSDSTIDRRIAGYLDNEKGNQVSRRVNSFLGLMVDSGLLIKLGDDAYQQSLLGAYEVSENYNKSLKTPIEERISALSNIYTSKEMKNQDVNDGTN